LAEAAVNALHHIEVIPNGTARAIVLARPRFDGNCLRRAYGFAKLAGDAALFPIRITTQGVFATEARTHLTLFKGVVDGRLGREEILHGQPEGLRKFTHDQRVDE